MWKKVWTEFRRTDPKQHSQVQSLNQPLHHHTANFKDPDKDSQCLVYLSKWLNSIKKEHKWLKNKTEPPLLDTRAKSSCAFLSIIKVSSSELYLVSFWSCSNVFQSSNKKRKDSIRFTAIHLMTCKSKITI